MSRFLRLAICLRQRLRPTLGTLRQDEEVRRGRNGMMFRYRTWALFWTKTAIIAELLFPLPALCSEAISPPFRSSSSIVTFKVSNYGQKEDDLVVTFGSVFARSDVRRGTAIDAVDAHGVSVPIQLDRKVTHPDGSLRHGVMTLLIPHLARGEEMPVTLRRASSAPVAGAPVSQSDLPTDFDTTVILRSGTHRLTASAREMLATGHAETWLQGPLVSEWWVTGPFRDESGKPDPHLAARFGIRCYGKGKPLRLDVVVENDWTFVPRPRTEFYDGEIDAGGKTVFARAGMVHPSQTRWRKGFWWSEAVALYVKQNLPYLKKARVVPNYDPDLHVSEAALAKMYGRFENSDRAPMAAATIMKYMPTTGGRPDIAPLPQWQAMYLLSMDPRAYEMTLQNADLGASFRSHYRNEKTGRPTSLSDYPDISANSNLVGKPGQPEIPDTGGYKDPLVPDQAHEPALDFIPYLVTGDRFYLEELEFWSQWNAMRTAGEYRGHGLGLLDWGQVRGQAWSLRALAQAAYIAPDSDPLKFVLLNQLKANIEHYEQRYSGNPSANEEGMLLDPTRGDAPEGAGLMAPWMDDYFTWSVDYVAGLGDVDALPLLRWKARFPVGRMIAPGFCWILATSYTLRVRDRAPEQFYPTFAKIYEASLAQRLKGSSLPADVKCGSGEMAQALGLASANVMSGSHADGGYPAFMQPALAAAVDSGIEGAESAWTLFQSRSDKPDYIIEPEWDIVPWPKD